MKNLRFTAKALAVTFFFCVVAASVANGQTSGSGLMWVYANNTGPGGLAPVIVYDRATGAEIRRFYPGASWSGGGCIFGRGIAYDPSDGNLWVTMNRGNCSTPRGGTTSDGWIHKISSYDGSDITAIKDPTDTGIGGLGGLGALDYDAQEGALYGVSYWGVCYAVNEFCNHWVYKIGGWKTEIPYPGVTEPHALAITRDANGRKVLNVNNGIIDAATGQILQGFTDWIYSGIDYDESNWQQVSRDGDADISIQDGRCDCPTITRPPTQNINTPWPLDLSGVDPNWSMIVDVTDNDGLVLRDIRLGQRYMVEKISVPYFYLHTTAFPKQRGELKPNGTDPTLRSRLVNFYTTTDSEKLVIEATYVIDQIPAGSPSCLHITQRYEFYRTRAGDNCEPSATLPCSRWKPIVRYQFMGKNDDFLNSVNIAQRQHRKVDGNAYNTVGLFRDNDSLGQFVGTGFDLFGRRRNPLESEWDDKVIVGGRNARTWDNVHQSYAGIIDEPYINPGCPECIHSHWRWGALTQILSPEGGGNLIGIPAGSKQDVDIGVVAYQAGEDHPFSTYNDAVNGLVQYWQPIRTHNTAGRNTLQIYRDSAPEDVVYWQSGTGYQVSDTFFAYGGFFNPTLPTQQLYGGGGSAPTQNASKNTPLDPQSSCSSDGISSITAGQIFASGDTTVAPFDATTGPPLPNGYTQIGNLSYDVTTTAESTGPDTVTFCVPSVTDQTSFDNLRVFHLEPDPYDPDELVWVDRTVLAPDPQAPDFGNKTINCRANFLSKYVVALLTQPQPPNTAVADLGVAVSDSPDGVVVGNDLTYLVTVSNAGPQIANNVVFSNSLSPEVKFVSVTTTQGTCIEVDGTVLCKLGAISVGNNAVVTIVTEPTENLVALPAQGKTITDVAFTKANEIDPNANNNSATENTTVLPPTNSAPTVSISTPASGDLIVGPTNINIVAKADDSDGSIASVEFYGDGNLIGTGATGAPDEYTITWNTVSFGTHNLIAVATDDLGKKTVSDATTFIVNGSASISITSPTIGAVFSRSANIAITANANITGGSISKVDFYLDGFYLLGSGILSGPDQYTVTWTGSLSGTHFFTAVATDNANVSTTSQSVSIVVNDPPLINLVVPLVGSVYSPAPATIPLTATANDDGAITKVDFYANGTLIGTNSSVGVYSFVYNWTNVAAGTYTIIAVATDSYGATATSSPVVVRVNSAPVVTMTSPSNGAQFTAPATVTITATATDSDGSVSSVDFLANGSRIGSGTSIGGNQYSFTWSSVGIGSYTFSAKATDNDGAFTTSSSEPTVSVTTPVLFVVGSTTLNSSDAAVKARLEALNSVVTVKDAASAQTADATGKALVVISSTVTPASVGTKFRTVTVPVITWESGLFTNMGMTGSTNKDFGTKTNQTQLAIVNSSHPLAAGLSGNVAVVTSSKTFDWGKPNANAISVATILNDAAKTAIFGYETGAVMPGLNAPARRLGFFMFDDTAASLNANGIALLDAAIRWTRGGGSISGTLSTSPPSTVNLTTEGVVDWAHWGLTGPTAFNHKGNITPQISNVTSFGTGTVGWFADSSTTCSWTDGTPTLTASNTPNGINVNGAVGNGFEITVPADTNPRTLNLYLGVWYAQGKLEASLSDGSAPNYINTALNNNGGGTFGFYTINFKAGSGAQTMKVRFTILNQYFSPNGNLAWRAATLQ